jgi:hypothetical protein
MGHRRGLKVKKENNFFPLLEFESRTVQPAVSSLYRYAVPVPKLCSYYNEILSNTFSIKMNTHNVFL